MQARGFADRVRPRLIPALAILLLLACALAGCGDVREFVAPSPPRVAGEWADLLKQVQAFERRIGFRDTDNFRSFSAEYGAYPFCGHVSRFHLPYSYEDARIEWFEPAGESECNDAELDADAYYGTVEALGESATPVTPAMVESRLDRFLYVVIHEDCHDQFELPFGVEEALCNVLTYHAMTAFSGEKFGYFAGASRAVRRYAGREAAHTRATVRYYGQLAALYDRHARSEISSDALLAERAAIFAAAECALGREPGALNNVTIANEMTYSRHYAFLEGVFDALERDLSRTVAFFRHLDRVKPTRASIMKLHGFASEKDLDFVRAYEAAVLETTTRSLAAWRVVG